MLEFNIPNNVSVEINLENMAKKVDAMLNAQAIQGRNVEALGEILYLRSETVSTYIVYMVYNTFFGSLILYHDGINCAFKAHIILL